MFAVLTDPARKGHGWDPEEFFHTGRYEITRCLLDLHNRGISFPQRRALDFGCGVGRLTQALCLHFDECIGVDIATSMIEVAGAANHFGGRCQYIINDQPHLRCLETGSIDFIYSNIALQHIAPEVSRAYLEEFIRLLTPEGVLVFQLPAERIPVPRTISCDFALPTEAMLASITPRETSIQAPPGLAVRVPLTVRNLSNYWWPCASSDPSRFRVYVGNHWRYPNGQMLRFDDQRFPLPFDIGPGASVELEPVLPVPDCEGTWLLEFDLVQEGIAWFSEQYIEPAVVRLSVREGTPLGELIELPGMEMHGLPLADVCRVLERAGGTVLFSEADHWAPGWIGYRYCAKRRGEEAQQVEPQ